MEVITGEDLRVPIKSWATDLEESALAQARNLAKLPFVASHVALMPDAHTGYGMPIGGVIATEGVIIPNAVGVDIGCGMIAVKLNMQYTTPEHLKNWMGIIRELIPVGFNKHKTPLTHLADVPSEVILSELRNAEKSLGTLGGGNHFIEIQKDEEGFIWVMIHSGSRNLGKKVADHHHKIAVDLNKMWYSDNVNTELSFLPLDTQYGAAYLEDMEYCIDYAKTNRDRMMTAVVGDEDNLEVILCSHNYARYENHFGRTLMVHRKGAISAREGELGIIPGCQGSKSYIVRGEGNRDSFMSSSHGAGRVMGRKQAQRELDLEEQKAILDKQGIIHGIRNQKDLDEAPGSYKSIDVVMANQTDLTEIIHTLSPLAVIKG